MRACQLTLMPGQRGLAMVEFALVLPIILLMMLVMAEFGRMLYQYNSLLQANRDAVRYVAGYAWSRNLGKVVVDDDLESRTKLVAVFGVPAVPSLEDEDKMTPEQREKALDREKTVRGLNASDVWVEPVGDDYVKVTIRYVFRPVIGGGVSLLAGGDLSLDFELVASSVMRGL